VLPPRTVTTDDLILILRMLYGALSTADPTGADPLTVAHRALDLVGLPVATPDAPASMETPVSDVQP
jgi:hypothetical protein